MLQMNLLATDSVITYEMATGYVEKTWDDRMLLLISVSTSGTTVGQTLTKTAFAVTLLRFANKWQRYGRKHYFLFLCSHSVPGALKSFQANRGPCHNSTCAPFCCIQS
jgi:hypothetical protein